MISKISKYTNQSEVIAVGLLAAACMVFVTPWYTGLLVVPWWGLIGIFAFLANRFLLQADLRLPIGHCLFAPASTLVSIITFAPFATVASEKLSGFSASRTHLSQLEQTIISEARSRLQSLSAFYAKARSGGAKIDDHAEFCEDHASLYALLALGHLRGSGLSPEAIARLAVIEADAAKASNEFNARKDAVSQ